MEPVETETGRLTRAVTGLEHEVRTLARTVKARNRVVALAAAVVVVLASSQVWDHAQTSRLADDDRARWCLVLGALTRSGTPGLDSARLARDLDCDTR